MYSEDCRKGFTGYAVLREEYSFCVEHHKLRDDEQWEIRLDRSVEVIMWRMLPARCEKFRFYQYQLFSSQP